MITQKETAFKPSNTPQLISIISRFGQPISVIFAEKKNADGTVSQSPFRAFDQKLPEGMKPAPSKYPPFIDSWKIEHLYCIFNHTQSRFQFWGITQNPIKDAITGINKAAVEAKKNISDVIIAVSKSGEGKATVYTLNPLSNKNGVDYQPIDAYILDFFIEQKALGNIKLSEIMTGGYPIQGDAMQPIYDLSKVEISFKTFASEPDFGKAKAIAAELLKRGDFTEDGIDYSASEVNNLLYKKAEG